MANRDEKIQYAKELIFNNPDLGRRKINAMLKDQFGSGLRSSYVNEIQRTIPRYQRFTQLRSDGFKITDARKWSVGDIQGQRIAQMRDAMHFIRQEKAVKVSPITPDTMAKIVADPKLLDLVIKLRQIYPAEYLYGYRDAKGRFKPGILSRPAETLTKQFKSKEWKQLILSQQQQVKAAVKAGIPLGAVLAEFAKRMRRDGTNPFDDIKALVDDEYPKKGKKRPPRRPLRPEYDKMLQIKLRSRRLHKPIKRLVAV